MNALILAAGEGTRHPMNLKQLLMIKKETIIGRIIRQCRNRDCEPWIVTHKREIGKIAKHLKINIFYPYERRWIVETLYSTRTMWEGKTIVLLGDVIYSKETMDLIFNSINRFCWFGNQAESFAIIFIEKIVDRIRQSCLNVIDKNYPHHQGTLRQLMFDYTQLNEDILFASENPNIKRIEDYTRDIDCKEDYANFNCEVLMASRLDDLP